MSYRSIILRASMLVAVLALMALAFVVAKPAGRADAANVSCTFATPLRQVIQAGGGDDSVTCNISVHGQTHTFVANFTITLGANPPVVVTSCTLDGNAVSVGPCP